MVDIKQKTPLERKQLKRWQLGQLAVAIVIFALLFFVSSRLFFRIDLTEENRFTIHPSTKSSVQNLEDIVFLKVYLDGDLPSDFKELRQSVLDILNEFRAFAPEKIQFDFVNPSEDPDQNVRREIYKDLIKKGLQPYTIRTEEKDGIVQKYVFPSITINFREKQIHVNLFSNSADDPNIPLAQLVNGAKERLEYTLLNAIRSITMKKPTSITFLDGWGGLEPIETYDIAVALAEMYSVSYVDIDEKVFALVDTLQGLRYDAVIIAKPYNKISDKNKYIIDQYVMNGGKILWLLDYVDVNMDSLSNSRTTTAMPRSRELNLDDMLFKWGVRINTTIIQDLQSASIPINTAMAGAEPQFNPVKWVYFPVVLPLADHAITKLVGKIKTEFPSSLDTIPTATKVDKKILLKTSEYSRAITTPTIIDLDIINKRPNPSTFKSFPIPIAVLLEGEFESIFRHRIVDEISKNPLFRFKETSKKTAMIVVSDGDIIKNYISKIERNIVPYPLGADKWFKNVYYNGNKEFILNAVNYLTNDNDLLVLRGRKLKLRLLDRTKVVKERLNWQIINVVFPPVLIILIGIIYGYFRHRKYSKR
ncbi:MAG: gliding motility-associated ABC transporter substrate-binding protein GldG [Salinivirgaceae bacterium]|nr:gliding motility-associated ABC transporter substrate-binding protein GldG [Salinivirgaceae bacterium]MDD4748085.1 gliding motility-associated ABC transporter substrate-binding protein GldG [Salinivirgaceae bacterium]MDY0278975.1 gliding motility-associated ABC transporter substrate-binding protein GldG [Salinivirgaceae bacterium]